MKSSKNIAVLIPAAGASSRMGSPKQLLPWGDTNLIGHCITTALELNCAETVVVLGAQFEQIRETIQNKSITVLDHKDWKNGLGSSISFGIKYIETIVPKVDGVLILLADQPLIDTQYLNEMISKFTSGQQQIIATNYHSERQGVPALFDRVYFTELSGLGDENGARQIIKRQSAKVVSISAEGKTADIDTEKDYRQLYRTNHQL